MEKKYKVSRLSERLSILDRINELKRDAKSILEMFPRENTDVVAETAPIEEKVESTASEVATSEIVPIGRGVFGDIYDQFRGKAKEAIDFLIKHKSGDLLGVFHRDGIGDIDLVWGDEKNSNGLGHIIDKHIKQHNDFANIDDAVRVIDDVISNGAISRENRDKIVLEKDGYRVVVGKQIRDNHGNIVDNKNWIITSFDKSRSKIEKTSSEKTLTAPLSDREADGVTLPSNEVSGSKDKKEVVESQDKDKNFGVAVTEADKADVMTEEFGNVDDGKIYRKASDTAIKASDEESREAEEIVFRAKADGSYMKAPNGVATKLSKSQWVQVRTRAFKDWFGDWEKVSRIEKLRNSAPIEISGTEYDGKYELNRSSAKEWIKDNLRGEYVNKDSGDVIKLSRKGADKVTSHGMGNEAHLKSIVVIPELVEKSIFICELPNEKSNGKYDSYRYYVCGLKIDGFDYTVKLTVGVKDGKQYYDHALTEIEKGKLLETISLNGFKTKGDVPVLSSTDVKDTKLVSLLQVNSSKLLDENGEPKAEDISKFESEKGDTVYRSGEFSPASDAEIGEAVRVGKSLGVEVEVVNEPGSENAGYYDTKTGQIVVNSATGGEACLVIYMTSLGARLKRLLIS